MKITKLLATAAISSTLVNTAIARDITMELTNLTHGMYFTPRLVVAHTADVDLFTAGEAASDELAWIAEAGSTSQFIAYLDDASRDANNDYITFNSLLAPATVAPYSAWTNVDDSFTHLSLLSMLVPSNDAFIGIDSWKIPSEPGTYIININAYDAGTEANDEISSVRSDVTEAGTGNALGGYGVPGMAVPDNADLRALVADDGTGVAIEIDGENQLADATDGNIHIHRNVLGDAEDTGGKSDLDSRVHRWLNPVARLKVTISE